ncbi:MAG: Ig-like domain-containing protein, partial [Flavobacteriaceae bacterium]|nr:Ig-like domain-containing protein [Flavobacteriaceae bacterium]
MKKVLLFAVFLVGFLNLTFAQQVSVDIQDPLPVCNSGDCVDLNATFTPVETTTNYRIESIPFGPAGLTGGIVLDATSDDVWSPYFNLPFRFCFYGQYYDRVLIGSNGLITFDTATFSPGFGCPWNLRGSSPIPTTNIPVRNAIYGVYQDTNITSPPVTNPALQNVNYYITGTAPNRKFVVNFNQLPLYWGTCSASGQQTSQIVLYETSNIIDINIVRRQSCFDWNDALGVVGILNASGSQGMAPPGRNLGTWNAATESWRFIPDGNVNTAQISWLENGNPIPGSTGLTTITVCPTVDTDYTAVVTYTQCDTTIRTVSDTVTVGPEPFVLFNEPEDIVICATGPGPYSFDLDQDAFMLNLADPPNAQDPNDYFITYHTSYADAVAGFPFIQPGTNPGELSNYLSNGGETIWVAVQDFWTNGCIQYRSFDLVVQADPSGDIGYTGSPYCTSDTNTYLPSTNTVAPLTGDFVVTPSTGLSIDTTTGEITPSTSAIGTYSVVYHIDATSTCPAYDTPPVEIIIQDCSSCSLALDTNFGPASQTICLGNSIADIVYNYGGDATSFDLQFTPNLPAGLSVNIVGSQLTITGTPTESGTFNYGISTLGCTSNIGPLSGSIEINLPSNAGTLSGNQTICENGTTVFTSNGDTGGNWSSDDTNVATVDNAGNITGIGAGTATITYEFAANGSCPPDSATLQVIVAPTNPATFNTIPAQCAGGSNPLPSTSLEGWSGTWSPA